MIQRTATRVLLAVLALAAGCRPTYAADPVPPMPPAPAPAPVVVQPAVTLPASVTVKSNHLARVAVAFVGDDVKWWTDSATIGAVDVFREYDPTSTAVVLRFAADDGAYQLHAVAAAVVNGKAVLSPVATCTLTFGTPGPPPIPPGPTPPGPTPPGPVSSAAWIIGLKDSDTMTEDAAAVLADADMWAKVKAGGVKWRVYDKSEADVAAKHYDQYASQAGGYPCVLLLDKTGKLLKAAKLPATPDALLSLLKGGA